MQARTILLIKLAVAVSLLCLVGFACWNYREKRIRDEEKLLNGLIIDSIDVEDAPVADVARLLVEKVHAMGHPEMRLRIYDDRRKAPNFHATIDELSHIERQHRITVSLASIPLEGLVSYVAYAGDSTIEVVGRELVVVPEPGTTKRFRRASYRMYPRFFENISQETVRDYIPNRYEGMTVEFKKEQSRVEIWAPEYDVELLGDIVSGWRRPGLIRGMWYLLQNGRTIPERID